MIADPIGIPACFSSGTRSADDPDYTAVTRAGQSVIMSMYKIKLGNQRRVITITWCRNLLLLHGLSVSVSAPLDEGQSSSSSSLSSSDGEGHYTCKVELKPWYFWRKQGSKHFNIDDGRKVDVFWDLKVAKFNNGETEPSSEYYVAVVYENEVVLLVGDLKNEAYKKTGSRPALFEPIIVSKKEHIFGKKKFMTKAKFHEKGRYHDIMIECKHKVDSDLEMEVKVDGNLVIHVKHLQWKFRGNESIRLNRLRVEVYWDVHDWLFSPGLRHALFIFKPIIPLSSTKTLSSVSPSSSVSLSSSPSLSSTPLSSQTTSSGSSIDGLNGSGLSEFCLFLYAWKVE